MAESTKIPTRKVAAGGIAGAITTVIISICKDAIGYEMSPDLAAAVTTLVSFAVSYFVPNPPEPTND
jgi:putative flippase GtrA